MNTRPPHLAILASLCFALLMGCSDDGTSPSTDSGADSGDTATDAISDSAETADDKDKEDTATNTEDTATNTEDTAPDATAEFTNEAVFGPIPSDLFEQVVIPTGFSGYMPLMKQLWAVTLVELDAPEPPYEIRGFRGAVMSGKEATPRGGDCDTTVNLAFVAYVGDADPTTFAGGAEDLDLPPIPYQASIESHGVAGDGGDSGAWTAEIVDAPLPDPIRIEQAGKLWIGYHQIENTEDGVACPITMDLSPDAIHESATGVTIQWSQGGDEPAWANTDPATIRPVVSVTIGY